MMKHWRLCLGLVGVIGLALLAGLPPLYLLVVACPVMMMAMMPGMRGSSEDPREPGARELDRPQERSDRP
jgi:hypothetical protein